MREYKNVEYDENGKIVSFVKGGLKVRNKLLDQDPDYYKKIGAMGGKKKGKKGFASEAVGADGLTGKERARVAGSKGGSKPRIK